MEPRRLTAHKLDDVLEGLRQGSEESIGTYLFRGLRLQISKFRASGAERFSRLYRRRRDLGLCVICGARVSGRNPRTGRLYRLCDEHRARIDRKSPG
jgi:hypothetical protein